MKFFPLAILFFVFTYFFTSCTNTNNLFEPVPAQSSGIHFNNKLDESDSLNVLNIENIYNGGGVGVGDFNNDGLPDLYFTGSMVDNKLYLNKGDLKFDDVTSASGTAGSGKWCRGVAVVDINNDGWQDIYVCATLQKTAADRENLLYINNGADKNGVPHFTESAKEYGLADTSQGTQAAFFDYDNDGDLDVYIANNQINKGGHENRFGQKIVDGSEPNTDKLFKNDWSEELNHPVYTNVSAEAGILIEGYAHAVSITDINKDGWKDIYVTNDFISNDLLWINNGDGTFTESLSTYFKHTSANAMGNDITDINNDGLLDVVALDMNPEDNYRKKMMLNPNSYLTYQNSDHFGFNYQYVRNTLQLNSGPTVGANDSIKPPIFSDIAFYAGVAETDWSWAPLVADFDNDGYRDMVITNGFPKDVTDHDFIAYRQQSLSIASTAQLLEEIPVVKLHNYAFKNNGDLTFTDVTEDWNMLQPSFSCGGVYVDLDNDGDLDCVVNNTNDEAFLFKNILNTQKKKAANYLKIQFKGSALNKDGIGAWANIYYNGGRQQVYENTPYRGYLSSVSSIAHFGLDTVSVVDSVVVRWPNGKKQVVLHVKANQLLSVDESAAHIPYSFSTGEIAEGTLFKDVTDSLHIHFNHKDRDFIDFNIQRLLPHKFSEYGPAVATGDIDGNGLDDVVCGGSFFYSAQLFFQQVDGSFIQKSLLTGTDTLNKNTEDTGLLLFDADGDGDLDLYIASGGFEGAHGSNSYQDRFYVNDGKGTFTQDELALPQNTTSKFCVRAIDFDKDNDLDLFVSGRVEPGSYPKPVSSFIFRNDTKGSKIKFTDVTSEVAADLVNIGLVCDALFSDFDNDGWQDLILAGEWMPVTFLKNNKGVFKKVTSATGVEGELGWWNSIAASDFDADGDVDYVVGNVGKNSFYRADKKYPVQITAADFDKNGSYDALPSIYLKNKEGKKEEFPVQSRDEVLEQLVRLKFIYPNYKTYANATFSEVLPDEQRKDALRLKANNFASVYLRNEGNGKFNLTPLPALAQLSTVCGILTDDFDGDGNADILINGNDYGTEVSVGRYDAFNGLLLKGNGKGGFTPKQVIESGFYVPGNGKALAKFRNGQGQTLIAASQNKGALKIFLLKKKVAQVALLPNEESVLFNWGNNKVQKEQLNFGSSFLSQSARFVQVPLEVQSVTIINSKGNKRVVAIERN